MDSHTKEDFLRFVDDYEKITSSSPRTAEGVRGACKSVISVIPGDAHVDTWDVDAILADFFSLNSVSEETKRSYRSRFKNAVSKYLAYKNGENVKSKPKRKKVTPQENCHIEEVKTFELPIPLRDDLIVMLTNLPRNLTKEEAKRISNIVESFAMFDDLTKE